MRFLFIFFISLSMVMPNLMKATTTTQRIIEQQAKALLTQFPTTSLTKTFLQYINKLPQIKTTILYHDAKKEHYYIKKLSPDLIPFSVDESFYYNNGNFEFLDLIAPLTILEKHGFKVNNKDHNPKILDFGYGSIGQLTLLSMMGWIAVGVDIDPLLPVLYSKAHSEKITPTQEPKKEQGSVHLFSGYYPKDQTIKNLIGNNYNIIIAKNTLKKGYIHPDRPIPQEHKDKLIDLGVTDDSFLDAIATALKPGGYFLIYNISPALTPIELPFIPWSDGRSPFERERFLKAGLEIIAFNQDDLPTIQKLGKILKWDKDGEMDLEKDLSVLYTLVRKR